MNQPKSRYAASNMIGYLTQVAASPVGGLIKHRAHALLRPLPGETVVDAGCGPGVDLVDFARSVGPAGRAIGIDTSQEMLDHAEQTARNSGTQAWTTLLRGSATRLPLDASSAHCWYSERVLQHLPGTQPLAALAEARRVLRPRGRLVIVDTDWGSLSIASTQPLLERRLVQLHASRFASGFVGRMLPRIVHDAGLIRTSVESFAAVLSAQSLDYVFEPTERAALAGGLMSMLEHRLWRQDLEQLRATGDAYATLTITLVAAVNS